MAGTTDKSGEWMAQWLKMQESLMKEWASSLGKMIKSSTPPEEWMKMPFSPGGLYEQWSKSLSDLDKKREEEGVGRLVYNRIASSSKVYMDLLNFWSKATGTLKSVPVGRTLTMEEISELRNNWMKNYRELMETLWGKRPASDEESLGKTLEGTAFSASDLTWSLVEPILKNVAQMPDIVQKISRGDTSAVLDLGGIFSKNYEDVVGRAMIAPSFGYFKVLNERIGQTIYAYARFNTAKNAFSSMLYKTGLKAAEKVYQRSSEFIGKEASPETFKAFYRLWWTINEETYHVLLISEEFTTMAKEMITRGLLFRKGFDELTDHVLKFTNIPGKKDMDEVYKTIWELKREVRNQKRAIRDLEKQAAAKNRRKKSSSE
jgi:class III poly(R)-hydroxyalkanoic acid synthase PhaE subunit